MTRRFALVVALATLLGPPACSGGDDATVDPMQEEDAVRQGGDSSSTMLGAVTLADSLFSFDPTLDASLSAEQNAAAIQSNAQMQLSGCGSVTASGTTVTVAFGAPPGCTLTNGTQVSGTVSATVTKAGGTVAVALAFTNVAVDGRTLSGTASFSTSNGTTYAVAADLTSGAQHLTAMLTIAATTSNVTIDGTAALVEAGVTTQITFNHVVYVIGDCYPSGGTLTVRIGRVTETVTFSASSATSGVVTVQQGRQTSTKTLPAYGDCPAT